MGSLFLDTHQDLGECPEFLCIVLHSLFHFGGVGGSGQSGIQRGRGAILQLVKCGLCSSCCLSCSSQIGSGSTQSGGTGQCIGIKGSRGHCPAYYGGSRGGCSRLGPYHRLYHRRTHYDGTRWLSFSISGGYGASLYDHRLTGSCGWLCSSLSVL